MSHSVRSHLSLEIDEYDASIRRWIPGYETMLTVAAEQVADRGPHRVVDLGSGTGALSEAILGHASVGHVELLDVDPDMMARARSRLEHFGSRVSFSLQSFDEPFAPCDAFTASLSLHHIPTIEEKARLFERAFEALEPGGLLVNADCCMPAEAAAREGRYRHWAEHQMAHGISVEEAYENFRSWAAEDTYLPLDDELAALRAVGFSAERVWNDGPIGVVVAAKPS
ncbi:MAG: class I SAM-dependent methyltransferase [Gemmatimonadota bacterium]